MSSNTSDSFQYMLENRRVISEILRNSSTLSGAWEMLPEKLPTIAKAVKFNTFRAYAKFLNVVAGELDEKDFLSVELGKVRQEKESLESELGKVRQNVSKPKNTKSVEVSVPKRVNGWGVQVKGDYYRLFKKINGKVKWIHIGRTWNLELARKKIEAFKS